MKIAFLYFASQYDSIFTSMHKLNTNLNLFPRYDVVNPVKLLFLWKRKSSSIRFWKHVKKSTLATSVVKSVFLQDQIGPWKDQILLPLKEIAKSQRNKFYF